MPDESKIIISRADLDKENYYVGNEVRPTREVRDDD